MEQDQTVSLLITSGNGPEECCMAVAHVCREIKAEAAVLGLIVDASETPSIKGSKSVVVVISGKRVQSFAQNWIGTIQWVSKSQLRPNHKRQNWYIGVAELKRAKRSKIELCLHDISFESFRAGGPGGQHQNTTDSAVRAIHKPTGLAVVAREMRSQHRNKALAVERLQKIIDAQSTADHEAGKTAQNQLHNQLERGNPTRCFKGEKFREVKHK